MRERVEALGGRFRVTTAPGQGTVVEAKLPLTVPDRGVGAMSRPRVLVVDDHHMLREGLASTPPA
jgi:hypothetical protein